MFALSWRDERCEPRAAPSDVDGADDHPRAQVALHAGAAADRGHRRRRDRPARHHAAAAALLHAHADVEKPSPATHPSGWPHTPASACSWTRAAARRPGVCGLPPGLWLLLPPFFMHTRRCRDRGLPGQHGPRGCLAEAGRGWRQLEACPGAGSSLRRASWPKPEPPSVSPPGRRRCRDQARCGTGFAASRRSRGCVRRLVVPSAAQRLAQPRPLRPLGRAGRPPRARRCRDQIGRYRPGAGAAQPAGWPRLAGARGQPEPCLVSSA